MAMLKSIFDNYISAAFYAVPILFLLSLLRLKKILKNRYLFLFAVFLLIAVSGRLGVFIFITKGVCSSRHYIPAVYLMTLLSSLGLVFFLYVLCRIFSCKSKTIFFSLLAIACLGYVAAGIIKSMRINYSKLYIKEMPAIIKNYMQANDLKGRYQVLSTEDERVRFNFYGITNFKCLKPKNRTRYDFSFEYGIPVFLLVKQRKDYENLKKCLLEVIKQVAENQDVELILLKSYVHRRRTTNIYYVKFTPRPVRDFKLLHSLDLSSQKDIDGKMQIPDNVPIDIKRIKRNKELFTYLKNNIWHIGGTIGCPFVFMPLPRHKKYQNYLIDITLKESSNACLTVYYRTVNRTDPKNVKTYYQQKILDKNKRYLLLFVPDHQFEENSISIGVSNSCKISSFKIFALMPPAEKNGSHLDKTP